MTYRGLTVHIIKNFRRMKLQVKFDQVDFFFFPELPLAHMMSVFATSSLKDNLYSLTAILHCPALGLKMACLVCRWMIMAKGVTCVLTHCQGKKGPKECHVLWAEWLRSLIPKPIIEASPSLHRLAVIYGGVGPYLVRITCTVEEPWFPIEHINAIKKGEGME